MSVKNAVIFNVEGARGRSDGGCDSLVAGDSYKGNRTMDDQIYNSRTLRAYLKYLQQRHPAVDRGALLAHAGIETHQIDDEGHWFTQQQANRFYAKTVELTDNQNIAFEAGLFAVSRKGLGLMSSQLVAFAGPHKAFSLLEKWSAQLSRSAFYRARTIDAQTVEVTVVTKPGVQEQAYQCENRKGYSEGLCQLFQLPGYTVEHPECMFAGGTCCRYLISWKKGAAQWLRAIKYYIFPPLALAILALVLLSGPAGSFPLALSVVLGLLLGIGWAEAAQQSRVLSQALERIRESSGESVEAIQRDYDHARVLNEIGQLMGVAGASEELPAALFAILHENLGFDSGFVLVGDLLNGAPACPVSYGLSKIEKRALLQGEAASGAGAPWLEAFQTGRAIVLNETAAPAAQGAAAAEQIFGRAAMVCCPIQHGGRSLGTFAVLRRGAGQALLQKEVNLLLAVASRVGLCLHNRRLTQQFVQTQKLECVGLLAGGVAHDFNNVLTIVLGYSELLKTEPGLREAARKRLEAISSAAEKGAAFTRQLLAFSRQQVVEPQVLSLDDTVRGIMTLAQSLIGDAVEVEVQIDADVPNIYADPSQIEQIILNLVVNARDAMPSGGQLRVSVCGESSAEEMAEPGVLIQVADSGEGIPAEIRERLFEPFFTTKPPGKGTGMGLSTVFNIVKQLKGRIEIESEPDQGTTFSIHLPGCLAHSSRADLDPSKPLPGGEEAVLVVDDEANIRTLIQGFLENLGYRVTLAADGAQALERLESSGERFDLLLSDIAMPRLGGVALAQRFKELYPQSAILLMSGYAEEASIEQAEQAALDIINKPIRPRELAIKLRAALDSSDTNVEA